ncbi:MAG: hypothetical protein J4G01_01780 [Dehalococcoidia bacterium]|nr:hypothetical protein [Dehalococcoidia bacterium]
MTPVSHSEETSTCLPFQELCGAKGSHLPVQRQRLQAGLRVVIGYQPVEKARAAKGRKSIKDEATVQRRHQATGEGGMKGGAGILPRDSIVALKDDVGLPDNLVGDNYLDSTRRETA